MKIKLIANSDEAKQYINSIQGLDCGYAYSYGFEPDQEINKENSWAMKLLSMLDKFFSKTNPLVDDEKQIITHIVNSAKLLEQAVEEEDHNYLSGMQISLIVPSKINSLIKSTYSSFSKITPNIPMTLRKLRQGVDEKITAIKADSRKMIISSEMFHSKDLNVLNQLGTDRAIQYVIFHEASHSFQTTNEMKNGTELNEHISSFFKKLTHLQEISEKNPEFIKVHDLLKEIQEGKKEFYAPRPQFMRDLQTLFREMYADVGSVLLSRNLDIKNGVFSKERTEELVNIISEDRITSHPIIPDMKYPGNYRYSFCHFTSQALNHLNEISDAMPNKVLTQKEMQDYCTECAQVGFARFLITSFFTHADLGPEVITILHMNENSENGYLPQKEDRKLTTKKFRELEEIAGNAWTKQFFNDFDKIKDTYDNVDRKLVWHAAVDKKKFDEVFSNEILWGEKKVSKEFPKDLILPADKNESMNSIDKIRAKSLKKDTNSPTMKI
jgi:hypothetical protein